MSVSSQQVLSKINHLRDLVHGAAPRLEGHAHGARHVREEARRQLQERIPVDPLPQVDLLLYGVY